jgi:hypothetical protein
MTTIQQLVQNGVFAILGQMVGAFTLTDAQIAAWAAEHYGGAYDPAVILHAIGLQHQAQEAAAALEDYWGGLTSAAPAVPVVPGYSTGGFTIDLVMAIQGTGIPGLDRYFTRVTIRSVADASAAQEQVDSLIDLLAKKYHFSVAMTTVTWTVRAVYAAP